MERVCFTGGWGAGRTTVRDELRRRGDVTVAIDYDGWELPDCRWVRGRYVESALHVFNHRRAGGHYWYRGGWNPAALAYWARLRLLPEALYRPQAQIEAEIESTTTTTRGQA